MSEVEKTLEEKIKAEAMRIAERHAILAIDDVYALAQVYVDDTATPLDDTLLAGLKMLKAELVKLADKIDGEENA